METRSGRIYPVDSEENRLQQYMNDRDTLVSKLKPGDHIAAKRRKLRKNYEHHGIYEGEKNGYQSVIHFQAGGSNNDRPPSQSQLTCTNKCGYEHPKEGKVVTSCIDCFSQGKTMFKMQYMLQKHLLSHEEDAKHKPGQLLNIIQGYGVFQKKYYLEHHKNGRLHGHSWVPNYRKRKRSCQYTLENQVRLYPIIMSSIKSSTQVLEDAREYIGTSRPYNLLCNNCEHFAVFCMTGKHVSPQIKQLHLTFVCDLPKCFSFFTPPSGTSDSGNNGYEHRYKEEEEEEEDDEENTLLENPIAKRIKFE